MAAKAPLIVIVGETASGKTTTAIKVAKELNGEIICADSRTIYKYMDIGTAKPTKSEQDQVKHHLLDLVKPSERYTAAEFQKAAEKRIADIASRGKIPVMIGGSGLYVDSVIFEYTFRPKADEKISANLKEQSADQLYDTAKNRGLEPVSSTNKRYLQRLIEVDQKPPQDRNSLRDNTLVIGLALNRTVLRTRVTQRVETMFKQGLRKEIDKLVQNYHWDDPGMTGIGYREFEPYLRGETSVSKVKQKIIHNTLQFAKRQRTWFKRNRYIKWVETSDEAVVLAKNFIEQKCT